MNIYVGNLDYKVIENDLTGIFEEYGVVSEARIIRDKFSGRSKGYGFVTMENNEEALEAIKHLHETHLKNREIIVNEARPKNNE
jgi:RNA recognition motif-containing protein